MQRCENKSIDTRTFPQIWSGFNKGEETFFRDKIKSEANVTDQTIWNWYTGSKSPAFANQRVIVSILAKMGYRTRINTLFPKGI